MESWLCTVIAVLAFAGAAEATGVFKHSDPATNAVQQKKFRSAP